MQLDEFDKLDLNNVANGAAKELFNHAVKEVFENIRDENRDPTVKRTITLTFEIKSDLDRQSAGITVTSKTKLCQVRSIMNMIFMRHEKGGLMGYTRNIHQRELDFPKDETGKIISMDQKGAK